MIRGTTPTHYFNIAFDTSEIKVVKIIYAQDDKKIFEKRTSDCELKGKTITTRLTQEDTFKFDCNKRVQIQLRVLTYSGQLLASPIKTISAGKCLENEVLK